MSGRDLPARRLGRLVFASSLIGVLLFALWPHPPSLPYLASDRAQHAAAFAFLTLAARHAWPRTHWGWLFAVLASFGLVIEVMQGLVPTGRKPELDDWLMDCAAIGAVLAVNAIWHRLCNWRRRTAP